MNDFAVQQGWQCPICKKVYAPSTPMCWYCGGESNTSTDVKSTGYIDWQKQQSITTAVYKPQEDNFTSISNGRDSFSAEDIRTCDNCKNISGLPSHNGTNEYSGKCTDCYDKCNWEQKGE